MGEEREGEQKKKRGAEEIRRCEKKRRCGPCSCEDK